MLTPQECFENFKKSMYTEAGREFLKTIYENLFRDIGNRVDITHDYIMNVKKLKEYFTYLYKLKEKGSIDFSGTADKADIVNKFSELIEIEELNKATEAVKEIKDFILENRTNINGLIILWYLLNCTRLKDLENYDDEKIENALLSPELLSMVITTRKEFFEITIDDLLVPIELLSPTRRKGSFDKSVFEKISEKIKEINHDFEYKDFEEQESEEILEWLKNNDNWLIDEKITKRIDIKIPERGKFIDFAAKLNKNLFIGAHKEQLGGGGAQDNQARDANRVYLYETKDISKLKEQFDAENIFMVIIIEGTYERLKGSRHWRDIFRQVEEESNKNKYLLNSFQFTELLKSA